MPQQMVTGSCQNILHWQWQYNISQAALLNRYGHRQSYSRSLELGQLCLNLLLLPRNISKDNYDVIHLCFDILDIDVEKTQSGSRTTHSTHGIVIQELRDSEKNYSCI